MKIVVDHVGKEICDKFKLCSIIYSMGDTYILEPLMNSTWAPSLFYSSRGGGRDFLCFTSSVLEKLARQQLTSEEQAWTEQLKKFYEKIEKELLNGHHMFQYPQNLRNKHIINIAKELASDLDNLCGGDYAKKQLEFYRNTKYIKTSLSNLDKLRGRR